MNSIKTKAPQDQKYNQPDTAQASKGSQSPLHTSSASFRFFSGPLKKISGQWGATPTLNLDTARDLKKY